ncbi:MAG: sigma-70 family RNA polymerase sigma factor [Candidatus Dormibacteraeota bacterium]|nr:sigma-70 family RNA polymerase sigma factor [Candidatus Dormibacteraeota bacterium]
MVRAFQAGSVAAFDQIFLRYHHAISGLTTRLVRDPLLAEDLAQETFFRVLRSLDRIDESFNFSAWIHRIATNLCYDELRRRKRAQGPQAAEEGPRSSNQVVGVEDPEEILRAMASTDQAGLPEDALAMRELRREVWAVAARLPENYRTVLSLRELQGLSYAGIARVMNLSDSAVETLLHRARRRFKAEFMFMSFAGAAGEEKCDLLDELLASFSPRSLAREQRQQVIIHTRTCPRCRQLKAPTGALPEDLEVE